MTLARGNSLLSGLLEDAEISALLGPDAQIAAMLAFEIALAQAEAEHGVIPVAAADAIAATLGGFHPDIVSLKASAEQDGVVVPELVRQMRKAVGDTYGAYVHHGATSQDVIDTALIMQVRACLELLERRLNSLVGAFDSLTGRLGSRRLMGHTRMQPAIGITVADRIASWSGPLQRHLVRLDSLRQSVLVVQFGGAAGTLDRLGGAALPVRAALARRLDLLDAPQWHSQRDRVAELGNWLSQVTGSLGKFGRDIALMAQAGTEIGLSGGGGSSAMPNKQNPVDAEVLVAMARFNATQLSGLHHALVHEQERSGAAWTLEWMILPQMIMAAGASTRLAARLAGNVVTLGT
jgi:3-carboxy-cis,cis-muconate cycloisomerase